MRIFLYYEGDSFLHRLNPVTKLGFAVLLMLTLTVIVDPITPLIVALLTLGTIVLLGGVPPGTLARALAPFAVIAVGVFWTTAVFYVAGPASAARPVLAVGPVTVGVEAAAYGLTIMFRILGVFAASLLFVLTTDPTDFVQALIRHLRLPYRFGYGVLAAYRFVPLFESELATIRAAHRVRGFGDGGGPVDRYRQFVGFMVPLLAGGVRKAERVALAMDARGFGAHADRTYYRPSRFRIADLAFAVGATLVLLAVLAGLAQLSWLGRLVPPFIASP